MSLLLSILLFILPAFADESVEQELKEIQKHADDMEQAVQKAMGVIPGMSNNNTAQASPLQKKVMALAADKEFTKALQDLWAHPNRNTLFIAQAIALLFMLLFKSWRQSKIKHWFRRLLSGLFYSFLTWLLLVVVLPLVLLGDPLRIVALKLWNTFIPYGV
jgi:uncharacterized BrkB/YihY/UPF0761 family membrane protein